ncbi:MAG TPA: DUF748 domain-containing protein [Thiobacillaceae bacterium]|nr:DUF748 domain-containing protein [Thiobacillaceae bacterium]
MWGRITRIITKLPFLAAAGVFGAYLAFGFLLVDPLAQKLLPWIGQEKLDSRLRAERVEFNPLTLELTVTGLALTEQDGAPLAGVDRLYANLETTGLFRWAWRIRDLQLDRPYATLETRPGGGLNWDALIARLNADERPPSDTIARMRVEHLRIAGGDIRYVDADRAGAPFVAALEPLDIELDGLSTLPEDRGNYMVAAKLPAQGGTLRWKGDVGLNPLASSGEIGLDGVRLANLVRVIKNPRNFELPSGTLAANLAYRFALVRDDAAGKASTAQAGMNRPWLQISGADLAVRDLAIAPHGGIGEAPAPVLQLDEARLGDARLDLAARTIEIGTINARGGKLAATRDATGRLDWSALFASAEAVPAAEPAVPESTVVEPVAPESEAPAQPWRIDVREIQIADWSGSFTDRGFIRPLSVEATGFGLTAAVKAEVGEHAGVELGPVNAALGPVEMRSGGKVVGSLQRAALVNAEWTLAERRLAAEALDLSGLKTELSLDANREPNWAEILRRSPGRVESAPVQPPSTEAPLEVRLARLALDGIALRLVDRSPSQPVSLDITDGFVTLRDLSFDPGRTLPLEAGFSLRQGGRFSAHGTLVPGRPSGTLEVDFTNLSLKPFAPYVNQFARLTLHSGAASTRGKLTFAPQKSGMAVNFGGRASVDELAITEEDTGDAFLGWKKLSSANVNLGLAPGRLHVNELVALNPFGKIIIFEDRSINFRRVLRSEPEAGAAGAETVTAPAETSGSSAFPLAIERLRIVGANVEFADLSLTPQFGTSMHDLGGVVSGLSNDPATVAQVELDGKVDEYGSARVRGTIQPFHATDFTDLELSFRNLEMTNLTPYSGKFAGRRIQSGKLSADLQYKIEDRQLAGENKFIVNKLRLGERVESPDATNLPLDLAIALLEDGNGVIDLDLPVSGSLDDPEFGYGRIIWKAFVNVMTKLVTAPFRALGKLLGVDSERLESIDFDPGGSALLPPEQEKLKTIAEALVRRPTLELVVQPGYDPEVDRRALQEQSMRSQAAAVAGIELAPGEAPGPIDVNNYAIRSWLEDRYAAVDRDGYKEIRARFEDRGAGARLGEHLVRPFKTRDEGPASAFHTELLERLTARTTIDDSALITLAEARGLAMRGELLARGLDAERFSVEAPSPKTARDRMVASGLKLVAAARAPAMEPAPAPSAP